MGRGGGERSRFLRPGDLSCFSLLLPLSLAEGAAIFFLSPSGDLSLTLSLSGSRRSFTGLLLGDVFFFGLERSLLLLLLLDELEDEEEREELPELLDDDRDDDRDELLSEELPLLSLLLDPESPFFFLFSRGFFLSLSEAADGDLVRAILQCSRA